MQSSIILKNGMIMPTLGMGTWMLGEHPSSEQMEKEALCAGLQAGMTLLDTAEMYGEGRSEKLIGKVIQGFSREQLFLVSKVYPHHAGRNNIFKSIENTLKRMQTDYLDLYLLHWRGSIPLAETVECMEQLVHEGKIRSWGVSNFDKEDMEELFSVPAGENCVVNQVLYHLGSRGIEYDLLPWQEQHQVAAMAYCPLAQAGDLKRHLLSSPAVQQVAEAHHISDFQVLLAFVLSRKNMIAIPRSAKADHVLANWETRQIELEASELAMLDEAFPAPNYKTILDVV